MLNAKFSSDSKFLLHCLLFCLVFILLILPLLDLFYNNIAMRDSIVRRMDSKFYEQTHVDILILGDSHSEVSLNPLFHQSAFNFSSSGESYLQTYYKLTSILASGTNCDFSLIVLPFDLHSFSSFRTERIVDASYWKRYISFGDFAMKVGLRVASEVFIDSWFKFQNESLNLAFLDLNTLLGSQTEDTETNQFRYSLGDFSVNSQSSRISSAESRFEHHFENSHPIDKRLVFSFEQIIHLCLENDITVVLVSYPITREYLDCVSAIHSRTANLAILDSLSLIDTVTLFDYSTLFCDMPSFFADPDHLNKLGSDSLTKKFAEDLQNFCLYID